jgi:hypothetical protein
MIPKSKLCLSRSWMLSSPGPTPVRWRNLTQRIAIFVNSLLASLVFRIFKNHDVPLSLALGWLAHDWSRYIVTVSVHIALRMPKVANGSLRWLADI